MAELLLYVGTFHQYIIEFINTTKENKMKEVLLSICTTALFAVPVVDAVVVDGSVPLGETTAAA